MILVRYDGKKIRQLLAFNLLNKLVQFFVFYELLDKGKPFERVGRKTSGPTSQTAAQDRPELKACIEKLNAAEDSRVAGQT